MAEEGSQRTKTPWHLRVVGIVSLLWNLVGVLDFVMTETRNQAYLKGMTQAQLDYFYGFPGWVVVAWGIATWGGALGSLLLLLRRRAALACFWASFAAMALTSIYNYALSNGLKVMGGGQALVFCGVILAVGLALVAYARSSRAKGILS